MGTNLENEATRRARRRLMAVGAVIAGALILFGLCRLSLWAYGGARSVVGGIATASARRAATAQVVARLARTQAALDATREARAKATATREAGERATATALIAGQATRQAAPSREAPPTRAPMVQRTFYLDDRGVTGIGASTPVVKGQVFDRDGSVLADGRAQVGMTFDGVFLTTAGLRNPLPTNPAGWYEAYVGRGQRIRIVSLIVDGQEVRLENADREWQAEASRWWHVDIRER